MAVAYANIPRDRFYALAHRGWAHHGLDNHQQSTRSWVDALDIGIVFDPVTNRRLHNMVAWNHAVCRASSVCDGAVAVKFYEMIPSKRRTWYELGTGAAAYARSGDFETAVRLQRQSMSRLENSNVSNKDKWVDGAAMRLALYEQGKPYTEY